MQKKKTYVSVTNNNMNSFSTFGDGEDPLAGSHNFYHEFIRENLFQSAEITSTLIREEENGKSVKPYAVYAIFVATVDIDYTIERRYSCFNNLYRKVSRRHSFKTEFPTKTFLTPSTNEAVVQSRKVQLNKFLKELIESDSRQLFVELLEFLEVKQVYEREKIQLPGQMDPNKRMDEEVILQLLNRLGSGQENPLFVMEQLEKQLFQSRLRITNQVIRQLFMGLGRRKGLLEISFSEQTHELVCFKGLSLANRLLNFQQNRDAQAFIRNFVSCPVKCLKIFPGLLVSSKIRLDYFRLLEIFFKRNCDINLEATMEFLFDQCPRERAQYERWVSLRQKGSTMVQPFAQKIMKEVVEEYEDKLSEVMEIVENSKNLRWKELRKTSKPDSYEFAQFSLSDKPLATYYIFHTVAPPEMLHDLFLDGVKWYRWVSSSRVDPITKIFNIQMHIDSCRKFEFISRVEQLPTGVLQTVRKPPKRRSSPQVNSYLEIVRVKKNIKVELATTVEVWRLYLDEETKKYFDKELELEQEPIAQILIQQ